MKQETNNGKNLVIVGSLIESKRAQKDMQKFAIVPFVIIIHAIVITALVISSIWSIPYIREEVKFPDTYVSTTIPIGGNSESSHGKTTEPPKIKVAKNFAPIEVPDYEPEIDSKVIEQAAQTGIDTGVDGGIGLETGDGNSLNRDDMIPTDVPQPPKEDIVIDTRKKANGVPPQIIYRVDPEYPELARKAHIEGMVILEAVVSKDGTVRTVTIQRSDNPVLELASVNAAKQFRFEPGRIDGKPVSSYCTIVIIFQLNK